jgi:hypothetical protein
MSERFRVFAVLRFDFYLGDDAAEEERVTVKEIVPTQAQAEQEVERLNALKGSPTRVKYMWQTTRYVPAQGVLEVDRRVAASSEVRLAAGRTLLEERVLLSFQHALLGAVTPALRGVAVSWTESRVAARFVYDERQPDRQRLLEVEAHVLADLEQDVESDFSIELAAPPVPLLLRCGEIWAYRRREGPAEGSEL